MRRREFVTMPGAVLAPVRAADSGISEPTRKVPVADRAGLIVCGGGPAGVAAALTAARQGADVLLIESRPFLGGVWTGSGVTHYIDGHGKGGLNEEIHRRLPVHRTFARHIYCMEEMKCLLDDLVAAAPLRLRLHTHVAGVLREGGRILGVFTESKAGREFFAAKVVIDATGDGDVAARAGCPFEVGRPGDSKTQPMTLFARIGGYRGQPAKGESLLAICRRAGWSPTYSGITLFPQPGKPGVFVLMATHLYGNALNPADLTAAEIRGRVEVRKTIEALKAQGGDDWKDVYLLESGPFIGVRETRRIRGRHYLTADEIRRGVRFDDGVCDVNMGFDIHTPDPKEGAGITRTAGRARPYQVPYRCLLPLEADNLLLAGRCISGDHAAHSSYRVTGNAVGIGEAAGLAAAIALASGKPPAGIDVPAYIRRLHAIRFPDRRGDVPDLGLPLAPVDLEERSGQAVQGTLL
jgi:glycine/D-amino acid oxidase-like deaminating enzyme